MEEEENDIKYKVSSIKWDSILPTGSLSNWKDSDTFFSKEGSISVLSTSQLG